MHFDLASLGDSALRLILALASGIGFLGAGIILREGINLHGLIPRRCCGVRPWSPRGRGQIDRTIPDA
jgi:hypothetical protein